MERKEEPAHLSIESSRALYIMKRLENNLLTFTNDLKSITPYQDHLPADCFFIAGLCRQSSGSALDQIVLLMTAVEEALVLGNITEAQRLLILYPLAEGRLTEASRILRDLTEVPVVRGPIALEKKRRVKAGAYSLVLEQKAAFSQAIEIAGRTFARNPYTGEITTPQDEEVLESNIQVIAQQLELEEEKKQVSDLARSEELARQLQAEFDKGPQSAVPLCPICLSAIAEEDFFPLETCGHLFHPPCIQQHLELAITESKFPMLCPYRSCGQEISILDIKERLSEEMVAKFEEFSFKHFVGLNKSELFCCPTPDCKYVFQFACEEEFTCPVCGKHYCLRCQVEFHQGISCEQYRKVNSPLPEDDQFLQMMQGAHFKQCPNCKFFVEKTQGCNHLVCRCKFEFCFQCGGAYGRCECRQARIITKPERHRMKPGPSRPLRPARKARRS